MALVNYQRAGGWEWSGVSNLLVAEKPEFSTRKHLLDVKITDTLRYFVMHKSHLRARHATILSSRLTKREKIDIVVHTSLDSNYFS